MADAGNDHRLCANEAPPAIMSIYLGQYINELFESIENSEKITSKKINEITLGVQNLPKVNKDYSDRNRTSPIAFTGNKFEFRALGASSNTSDAVTTLNLICAYGYHEIYNRIISKKGNDIKQKALEVVKEIIKETKDVRFEKNGYSLEWQEEAKKRGLPNAKNTPDALELLLDKKVVKLYEDYKILSERELNSKIEIKLENYIKLKNIEFEYAIKMINTLLLPAILEQINDLSIVNKHIEDAKLESKNIYKELKILINIYDNVRENSKKLKDFINKNNSYGNIKNLLTVAKNVANEGSEILNLIRKDIDTAEDLVSDKYWRLASYQKLLTEL